MKKIVSILLVWMMVLCFSGCAAPANGESQPSASTPSLEERGLEMVALLDEMARTDDYIAAMSANDAILEVVHQIRQGDYAEPKATYQISFPEDILNTISELGVSLEENNSEALQNQLRQRLAGSLVSQINALSGTSALATASILTVTDFFAASGLSETVAYLYTFESGYPILITFSPNRDTDAVLISGSFLLTDEFDLDDPDEIRLALLAASYFADCEVTHLQ